MKYRALDYFLIGIGVGTLALSIPAYYKSTDIELKGHLCHESFHSGWACQIKADQGTYTTR